MIGYIDGFNFAELECQKYYSCPANWEVEKKKNLAQSRIFSGEWYGAQKRDGALYVFLKDEDGNISLRGRSKSVNGTYIDKWDHVPQFYAWAAEVPNGTCVLGEVYWPGHEGSYNTTSIMNCLAEKAVARQAKEDSKLHYYIFDVMAYAGQSYLRKPALERFNSIKSVAGNSTYIEAAEYKCGNELWSMLQQLLGDGYEGIVITQKDAKYEPGKRPSKTTLKIKKELQETLDVVIMGANAPTRTYAGAYIENWKYWENDVTGERFEGDYYNEFLKGSMMTPVTKAWYYNWAGSLIIGARKDDKVVQIGNLSGVTEEILEHWQDYKGRVIEVTAMEVMKETKGLRHSKFLGFRDDLLPKDTDWYRIFGKD